MDEFITIINQWIEWPYLLVFVFFTYGLKELFVSLVRGVTGMQVPVKYVVFYIATALAWPYWYVVTTMIGESVNPLKLLITYAVGTSLYDMVLDGLVNRIGKWIKG